MALSNLQILKIWWLCVNVVTMYRDSHTDCTLVNLQLIAGSKFACVAVRQEFHLVVISKVNPSQISKFRIRKGCSCSNFWLLLHHMRC